MKYVVGIDPGSRTGVAWWLAKEKVFSGIDTMPIHRAMRAVERCDQKEVLVVIEDARLRNYFHAADVRMAKYGAGIREGVGSVKRDCSIWEAYLTDLGIPVQMVAPRAGKTKLNSDQFKKLTGWTERTSVHARDAAMLVWQWRL